MSRDDSEQVVVMGAGPAGLAAAHALSKQGRAAVVFERSNAVGGLARTVEWKGYRFDIGGHRFFTRYHRVQALWDEILGEELLVRERMSRILYRGKLFDYPLSPANALRNLGPAESARCMASFARARAQPPRTAHTFEEWVSDRFGSRLFGIFFRTYTEKVWGIPCSELSADWAAQRIKNLSLGGVLRQALRPPGDRRVTSLIEQFHYPRLGPGMMYESMRDAIEALGNTVHMQNTVSGVQRDGFHVTGVVVKDADGNQRIETGRHYLSSIPITVLINAFDPPPPKEVVDAVNSLEFRHLVVVCLIAQGENLFPDTWVYVHSPELRVGRIQNYGNWSPDLVGAAGTSGLGMEYFTGSDRPLWADSDDNIIQMAKHELAQTGLCNPPITDARVIRAPRAYPVYRIGYERQLQVVIDWIRQFENLQAMGRYGMFKYNNSDHSILTALLSVENIDGAGHDVWAVNSDEQYLEEIEKS